MIYRRARRERGESQFTTEAPFDFAQGGLRHRETRAIKDCHPERSEATTERSRRISCYSTSAPARKEFLTTARLRGVAHRTPAITKALLCVLCGRSPRPLRFKILFPLCLCDSVGKRSYAKRNSFVRNSLIVSRSFAAFSNSNFFAASRISLSSLAINVSSSSWDLNSGILPSSTGARSA